MKTLITTVILLLPITLFSQGKNELKFDAFGAFKQGYELSYERIINNKFGIEIGFGFNNDPYALDTIPISTTVLTSGETPFVFFDRKSYTANLEIKYYPFQKTMGEGMMFGAFLRYASEPQFEQNYFDAYELYKGSVAPEPTHSITVGGSFGYKFLWKQRIILEPVLGIGVNLIRPYPNERGNSYLVGGYFKIKAGYRF